VRPLSELVTSSTEEEKICLLSLIAGLLAWNGGITWLAILLFIKTGFDFICLTVASLKETEAKSEKESK